jgi:hypothetical protein
VGLTRFLDYLISAYMPSTYQYYNFLSLQRIIIDPNISDFLIILYVENKSVDLFIKYSFSFFMNGAKALSEQSICFVKWVLEVNDIVNCLMQEWKWV